MVARVLFCLFACVSTVCGAQNPPPYLAPKKVSVLPVVFVPRNGTAPTRAHKQIVQKHIEWTKKRYRELTGSTFRLAQPAPKVIRGRLGLGEYKQLKTKALAHLLSEILPATNCNRFNCPYVYAIVVMNDQNDWPTGLGGVLNGGIGTGAGAFYMSSFAFTKKPNAQSTLQHELGHAFGLPHVDAYGYELIGNGPSIMSYNKKHHTNGFRPSATPGVFIPEDLRALAVNDRAFDNLEFDPEKDVPLNYKIHQKLKWQGIFEIPGQPPYKIDVASDAGSSFGSLVRRCVIDMIEESPGPEITMNPRSMWETQKLKDGIAVLDLTFPFPVELSSIKVYSGHSGSIHAVQQATVECKSESGEYRKLASVKFADRDSTLQFEATKSKSWRLHFVAGKTNKVTIRGIRFFHSSGEIFPQLACLVD